MSWFNIFSDAKDLASEYIEDPDKRNELKAMLDKMEIQTYQIALQTKTIPWVDALHKMSRPIISVVTIITIGIVISINPEIDIVKLMSGGLPAVVYTLIKGKGQ